MVALKNKALLVEVSLFLMNVCLSTSLLGILPQENLGSSFFLLVFEFLFFFFCARRVSAFLVFLFCFFFFFPKKQFLTSRIGK